MQVLHKYRAASKRQALHDNDNSYGYNPFRKRTAESNDTNEAELSALKRASALAEDRPPTIFEQCRRTADLDEEWVPEHPNTMPVGLGSPVHHSSPAVDTFVDVESIKSTTGPAQQPSPGPAIPSNFFVTQWHRLKQRIHLINESKVQRASAHVGASAVVNKLVNKLDRQKQVLLIEFEHLDVTGETEIQLILTRMYC